MGLRLEKRGEETGWGREEMGGWEEMTFLLCTLVEARVGICVAYISDRPEPGRHEARAVGQHRVRSGGSAVRGRLLPGVQ